MCVAQAEFGTVKGGCVYCVVLKVHNRGAAPCGIRVAKTPVDSGLDASCLADKVCVCVCVYVSVSVSVSASVSVCLSLNLSLPPSLSLPLSLSLICCATE